MARGPLLCQAAEGRALLCLDDGAMWYCDVAGASLAMRRCGAPVPREKGFRAVPLRLPDGRLLVAEARPSSIALISTEGDPSFERVGDVPEDPGFGISTALLGGRLVVGLTGECGSKGLWVFDTRTHASSPVRLGDWRRTEGWVPLVARGGALYVLGGTGRGAASIFPTSALAEAAVSRSARRVFRAVLGLPIVSAAAYRRGRCFLPPVRV